MSKKQNTETHKKLNEGVTIFTPIEVKKKEKKNILKLLVLDILDLREEAGKSLAYLYDKITMVI